MSPMPLQARALFARGGAASAAPPVGLAWVLRLRVGLALMLALALGFVQASLSVPFNFVAIYVQIAAGALLGIPLTALAKRRAPLADRLVGPLLAFDALWLTAILAQSGGPTNPFTVLYLVQVAVAAVCLNARWTWVLAAVTCVAFGSLFVVTPEPLIHALHHGEGFYVHLRGMWISYFAAAIAVAYFVARLARAHEARERELLQAAKRAEQLAALTTLAAGAAHELGTPLGTIALIASDLLAATQSGSAELRADAELLEQEVRRCRSILQGMSGHALALPQATPLSADLRELAAELVAALPAARRQQVHIAVIGEPVFVMYRDAVLSVLTQLLRNALDAVAAETKAGNGAPAGSPRTGTPAAENPAKGNQVRLILDARADWLVCKVEDEGPGISPEVLQRVGQPFFTTKEPGAGLGLGMFLVQTVAERISGRLLLQSAPGHGTIATFEVPRP